jgi:putative Holliday junction resolvase
MRIMALDVGVKTIGIAVSDALGVTAQGRPTLRRTNLDADLRHLHRLAEEDEVYQIVVGKPLHMNGSESRQSEKAARFARKLTESLGIPVLLWDERLTTYMAEEHLEQMGLNWRKRKKHVDRVAAMFILQSYLDTQRSR